MGKGLNFILFVTMGYGFGIEREFGQFKYYTAIKPRVVFTLLFQEIFEYDSKYILLVVVLL